MTAWQFFGSTGTGGGGGAGTIDATVADSGADFTTIQAAWDAGNSFLAIIGDLTVAAKQDAPDRDVGLFVEEGVTATFDEFRIDAGGFARKIYLHGPGTITYDPPVGFNLVGNANLTNPGSEVFIGGGISIENLSSNPITPVCNGDFAQYWDGFRLTGGNDGTAGIRVGRRYSIKNGTFVGGGASCNDILLISPIAGSYVGITENLRFEGTYQSGQSIVRENDDIGGVINVAKHTGWLFNTAGGTNHSVRLSGSTLDTVQNNSVMTLTFIMEPLTTLKNVRMRTSTRVMSAQYQDNCTFENCWIRGLSEESATARDGLCVTSCRIEDAMTIRGSFNDIAGSILEDGISYSSGANDNSLSDCFAFDPDNPSNGVTVTVDVGALRNRFFNVHSDTQIVANNDSTFILGNPVNQGVSVSIIPQSVGLGNLSNRAAAKLQVDSTTQGVMLSRWTTAQETTNTGAMGSADAGIMWFNTTLSQFRGWDGSSIVSLS